MQIQSEQQQYLVKLADAKLKLMSPENQLSLQNPLGQTEIVEVPDIAQTLEMRHVELLSLLHKCPASQFFGSYRIRQTMSEIPLKEARKLIFNMIRQ